MPSGATPQQQDAASLDVSGAVVQPSFRSTPWAAEAAFAAEGANRAAARIAFISESGTCRAPLAAAAFELLLEERGLTTAGIQCECRATRDFNLGDPADPSAAAVAAELGLQLPPGYQAQQFKEARDIVDFDVVLVMDKFTAADVLREVGGWVAWVGGWLLVGGQEGALPASTAASDALHCETRKHTTALPQMTG
jgi:protein-tyrosine-phosphatase